MPYPVSHESVTVVRMGTAPNAPVVNRTNKVTVAVSADSIAGSIDKSDTNALGQAWAGELTVRGGNTSGTITLDPGHSVVSGRVDVYFADGKRRGMTGTVTGDSLAITGGSGDNLPALNAAVTAMNPEVETMVFDGDDMQALLVTGDTGPRFQVVVTDASDVELLLIELEEPAALNSYSWVFGVGTNPLDGDTVGKVYISQDLESENDIQFLALKS